MNDMTQDDSWKGEHLIRNVYSVMGRPGSISVAEIMDAKKRGLGYDELAYEKNVGRTTIEKACSRAGVSLAKRRRKS